MALKNYGAYLSNKLSFLIDSGEAHGFMIDRDIMFGKCKFSRRKPKQMH
jgi:hypothetical protein